MADAAYPPGQPAWFAGAVAAAVGPAVAATVGPAVAAAVGPAVAAAIAPLQIQIAALQAQLSNLAIRKRNREARTVNGPLVPIQKEVVGTGVGGFFGALPAGFAPGVIGATMPGFPATVNALPVLTPAAIQALGQWYNTMFGIVPADTPQDQIVKFSIWVYDHS